MGNGRPKSSVVAGNCSAQLFVGAGGRIYPNYTQLGTQTGRQASWGPNILGLGRIFRPLLIALTGRGLGEVDLSQIEISIAGAVYHDACLVEMFNTGDVYSSMAQYFFRAELDEADRTAPDNIFKKKHPLLRAKMKVCTLAQGKRTSNPLIHRELHC